MEPISYARHQFPPAVIQHAIWLYLRFTLSYRDIEELLAERGLDVSYETIRRWVGKFGPAIARNLRQLRCRPSSRWHLDEIAYVHESDRHFHQSGHLRFNHGRHFARATAGPAPWGGARRGRLT